MRVGGKNAAMAYPILPQYSFSANILCRLILVNCFIERLYFQNITRFGPLFIIYRANAYTCLHKLSLTNLMALMCVDSCQLLVDCILWENISMSVAQENEVL